MVGTLPYVGGRLANTLASMLDMKFVQLRAQIDRPCCCDLFMVSVERKRRRAQRMWSNTICGSTGYDDVQLDLSLSDVFGED